MKAWPGAVVTCRGWPRNHGAGPARHANQAQLDPRCAGIETGPLALADDSAIIASTPIILSLGITHVRTSLPAEPACDLPGALRFARLGTERRGAARASEHPGGNSLVAAGARAARWRGKAVSHRSAGIPGRAARRVQDGRLQVADRAARPVQQEREDVPEKVPPAGGLLQHGAGARREQQNAPARHARRAAQRQAKKTPSSTSNKPSA